MNSFSWLQNIYRTQAFFERHDGLVKIPFKGCSDFSNYLSAMTASIYSSGGLTEDAFEVACFCPIKLRPYLNLCPTQLTLLSQNLD